MLLRACLSKSRAFHGQPDRHDRRRAAPRRTGGGADEHGRQLTSWSSTTTPAGLYLKSHILRKAGYTSYEAPTGAAAIGLLPCGVARPRAAGRSSARHAAASMCAGEIKAAYPGHRGAANLRRRSPAAHDRAIALDGGADAFLVEPIEPEELLATANALLRMREAEQALRRMNETLENAGRRTHARADRSQSPAGDRSRRSAARPKTCCGIPRSWKRSASLPAASRTTSTTCSP